MDPGALPGLVGRDALAEVPSAVLALAGLVVAVALARRRTHAALLVAAGSVLVLVADGQALAGPPLEMLLADMTLSGALTPDRAGLIRTGYEIAGGLLSAASIALLLAGALVAMRGAGARLPAHARSERFLVGLTYTSVASLAAAVAVVALAGANAAFAIAGHPCAGAPSPGMDPGTYTAGGLRAPATLHGRCRSEPTTAREVKDARQARDEFSQGIGGGPSIFATYGSLTTLLQLYAGRGATTPDAYFAGSQVTYRTFGDVTCGTLGVSICIRSDARQRLTVVVSGFADPGVVAAAVDEAWRVEGGH